MASLTIVIYNNNIFIAQATALTKNIGTQGAWIGIHKTAKELFFITLFQRSFSFIVFYKTFLRTIILNIFSEKNCLWTLYFIVLSTFERRH
jgi:hypothetical protein